MDIQVALYSPYIPTGNYITGLVNFSPKGELANRTEVT